MCLKSINTENQERLFQQAKSIASKCSNRKPDNVISSVLLRLQAREISGKLSNMYGKVESRVGSVASVVEPFVNLIVFFVNLSDFCSLHP